MKGFDGKPLQFTKGKSQMFAYRPWEWKKGNCYGVASAFAVQLNVQQDFRSVYAGEKSNVFNKINGATWMDRDQDWKYLVYI